jgi:hypothetical protein
MSEELEQDIRNILDRLDEAALTHDLPASAEMWSRLQFRLAYRPRSNRYASQASTLLAALYIFAFLMWFTWSGWLSVSLLAITVSAATASLYLTLHVSRIFRS